MSDFRVLTSAGSLASKAWAICFVAEFLVDVVYVVSSDCRRSIGIMASSDNHYGNPGFGYLNPNFFLKKFSDLASA